MLLKDSKKNSAFPLAVSLKNVSYWSEITNSFEDKLLNPPASRIYKTYLLKIYFVIGTIPGLQNTVCTKSANSSPTKVEKDKNISKNSRIILGVEVGGRVGERRGVTKRYNSKCKTELWWFMETEGRAVWRE